jgi:hypothetical protein
VFAGAAADMPAGVANNDFTQGTVLDDAYANETLATATNLGASNYQSDTRFDFRVQGVLRDGTDVDFYKFVAPTVSTPTNMVVMAWSTGQTPVYSKLQVYDAAGNLVNSDVVVNDQGNYVLQVNNITSGGMYYVSVAASNPSANNAGSYVLGVDFGNGTPVLQSAGAGTLSSDTVVESWRTLNVLQGQVMHFVLDASAIASVDSAVLMKIYDSNNNVVFTLLSTNGVAVSGNVFLAAGNYTVRIEGGTRTGVALPSILYDVRTVRVTDPIDPIPLDPTLGPVGVTAPTFGWLQADPTSYSVLETIDPYSNPWMGI